MGETIKTVRAASGVVSSGALPRGVTREEADVSRFWSRVREDDSGCWLWTGPIGRGGYGKIEWQGHERAAHRVAISIFREDPTGRLVDHMCRVRACVNPAHLRLVDARTNSIENSDGVTAKNAKKTHCIRGHELSGENLWVRRVRGGLSWRNCRACRRKSRAVLRALGVRGGA